LPDPARRAIGLALSAPECQPGLAIIPGAMPTYEYRCKKGHHFEVQRRIGEDSTTSCEVCGQPVSRVFHPIAVHFKGSGFYNTDYGTRKRSREMKEGKEGVGKSEKSEGSKDSKSNSSSDSSSSSDSGSSKSSDSGAKKSEAKSSKAD
jgi:putative FmdB family regulatory protein